MNAVRREALELIGRTEDDLTDIELVSRASDDFWYVDLCIEQLHRLPCEIDSLLTCREYTTLQAYGMVKRAMRKMQQFFQPKPQQQGAH